MHWFFVSANVFAAQFPIRVRFDLKGSTFRRYASAEEREKGALAVLKDLDFLDVGDPIVFQKTIDARKTLRVLEADTNWLAKHRLIDYSMMIGLAHRPGSKLPFMRHTVHADIISPQRRDGSNVVYIGIIDILTPYGWKKRLERLFHCFRKDISCQEPSFYADRFLKFASFVLREPPPGPTEYFELPNVSFVLSSSIDQSR